MSKEEVKGETEKEGKRQKRQKRGRKKNDRSGRREVEEDEEEILLPWAFLRRGMKPWVTLSIP